MLVVLVFVIYIFAQHSHETDARYVSTMTYYYFYCCCRFVRAFVGSYLRYCVIYLAHQPQSLVE